MTHAVLFGHLHAPEEKLIELEGYFSSAAKVSRSCKRKLNDTEANGSQETSHVSR